MAKGSDVEPTVKFTDADLDRVWDRLGPEGADDEDEDEGATELIQMLGHDDLEAVESDTGVFSLEEPSVHTDPALAARYLMPHTPTPARHRISQALSHPFLMRAMLAAGVVGMSAAALWWLRT
jgi:hypothetical protein